jgi:hypothetical protein
MKQFTLTLAIAGALLSGLHSTPIPLYSPKRPMPTTVIGNDVLLMRGTFELPPVSH